MGYIAEELLKKLSPTQKLYVLYLDKEEIDLTIKFGSKQVIYNKKLKLISFEEVKKINILECEMVIPFPYMKAIGEKHPLYSIIEDIKIKQISYETTKEKMYQNFLDNIGLNSSDINSYKISDPKKVAILVSAGPSLEKYLYLLLEYRKFLYILCVGSALKILLNNNIIPDAVIISDCSERVVNQFNGKQHIPLFYLSTANHNAVKSFVGERYILFQKGLSYAEEKAKLKSIPTIETGGSVATIGLSVLELLKFKTVVLFGQDLGFQGLNTHSRLSSSNTAYNQPIEFKKIKSNSDKFINTSSSYNIFKRWIENMAEKSLMKIYNIAFDGAKIKGCPFITHKEFQKLILKESE